jgi:hypothetical protein
VPTDPDDAARELVGEMLARRRLDLSPRYKNRTVFADERGVEYRIVSAIENGERANFNDATITALEAAYELAVGAIGHAYGGGELVLRDASHPYRPVRAVPRPGDDPGAEPEPTVDEMIAEVSRTTAFPARLRMRIVAVLAEQKAREEGTGGEAGGNARLLPTGRKDYITTCPSGF